MIIFLLCLLLSFPPVMPAAEIYQWRDANGNVHFSDKPAEKAQVILIETGPPSPDTKQQYEKAQSDIAQTIERQRHDRQRREKATSIRHNRNEREKAAQRTRCEKAKLSLDKEQLRWKYQRRKGYKPEQKARYKEREVVLMVRVEQHCAK